MIVKAWKSGSNINSSYGIRIGNKNRKTSFKKNWSNVLIKINGINYTCKITSGFWNNCPEIRDKAIKAWLKSNNNLTWLNGEPPSFNLVHISGNQFRLY